MAKKKKKGSSVFHASAPTAAEDGILLESKDQKEESEGESIEGFVQNIVEILKDTPTEDTFSAGFSLPEWLHQSIEIIAHMRGGNPQGSEALLSKLIQQKFKNAGSPELTSSLHKKILDMLISMRKITTLVHPEGKLSDFIGALRANNPEKLKVYFEKQAVHDPLISLTKEERLVVEKFDKDYFYTRSKYPNYYPNSSLAEEMDRIVQEPFLEPVFYDPVPPPKTRIEQWKVKNKKLLHSLNCRIEEYRLKAQPCALFTGIMQSAINNAKDRMLGELCETWSIRTNRNVLDFPYNLVLHKRHLLVMRKQINYQIKKMNCLISRLFLEFVNNGIFSKKMTISSFSELTAYFFDKIELLLEEDFSFLFSLCSYKNNEWKQEAEELFDCISRLKTAFSVFHIDENTLSQKQKEIIEKMDKWQQDLRGASTPALYQSVPPVLYACMDDIYNLVPLTKGQKRKAQLNESRLPFSEKIQKALRSNSQLDEEIAAALPADVRQVEETIEILGDLLVQYGKKVVDLKDTDLDTLKKYSNLSHVALFFIGFCLRAGKVVARTSQDVEINLHVMHIHCLEKCTSMVRAIQEKMVAQQSIGEVKAAQIKWTQEYAHLAHIVEKVGEKIHVHEIESKRNTDKPIQELTYSEMFSPTDAAAERVVRERHLHNIKAHTQRGEYIKAEEECHVWLGEASTELEELQVRFQYVRITLQETKMYLKNPLDEISIPQVQTSYLDLIGHHKLLVFLLNKYVGEATQDDKLHAQESENVRRMIVAGRQQATAVHKVGKCMEAEKNRFVLRSHVLECSRLAKRAEVGETWSRNDRVKEKGFAPLTLEQREVNKCLQLWNIPLEELDQEIDKLDDVLENLATATKEIEKTIDNLDALQKKEKRWRQKGKLDTNPAAAASSASALTGASEEVAITPDLKSLEIVVQPQKKTNQKGIELSTIAVSQEGIEKAEVSPLTVAHARDYFIPTVKDEIAEKRKKGRGRPAFYQELSVGEVSPPQSLQDPASVANRFAHFQPAPALVPKCAVVHSRFLKRSIFPINPQVDLFFCKFSRTEAECIVMRGGAILDTLYGQRNQIRDWDSVTGVGQDVLCNRWLKGILHSKLKPSQYITNLSVGKFGATGAVAEVISVNGLVSPHVDPEACAHYLRQNMIFTPDALCRIYTITGVVWFDALTARIISGPDKFSCISHIEDRVLHLIDPSCAGLKEDPIRMLHLLNKMWMKQFTVNSDLQDWMHREGHAYLETMLQDTSDKKYRHACVYFGKLSNKTLLCEQEQDDSAAPLGLTNAVCRMRAALYAGPHGFVKADVAPLLAISEAETKEEAENLYGWGL